MPSMLNDSGKNENSSSLEDPIIIIVNVPVRKEVYHVEIGMSVQLK